MSACSTSLSCPFLTTFSGERLCEMYNLSGDHLKWKWEAVNFGKPRQMHYTMKDILELKARCKSDLEKAGRDAPKARGNLDGRLSRSFGGLQGRGGLPVNITRNLPKSARRDGFAVTRGGGRRQPMAGPSKVRFFGPSTDEELSIARSCESRYHVKVGYSESPLSRPIYVREGFRPRCW